MKVSIYSIYHGQDEMHDATGRPAGDADRRGPRYFPGTPCRITMVGQKGRVSLKNQEGIP